MKRPSNHFVASRRTGPNSRLKAAYAGSRWPPDGRGIRSDVDNLAKFVMDSLNGVLYVDDRQVVRLKAMKVLDSEGPCLGATEVEISVFVEGDS
jgi:Holliday junction resolvase RusA-like endonuclease